VDTSAKAKAARANGSRGGRPTERGPRGIPWGKVRRAARLGAKRETILTALGVGPEKLADPEVLARLQQELDRGRALLEIDVLEQVAGLRTGKGLGSVNATIASLREIHGWDRPDSARVKDKQRPDREAAVAGIERLLRRFRAPR
jgi:hypothetical protein